MIFHDIYTDIPREEIARYHEDILAHVGRWNPSRG